MDPLGQGRRTPDRRRAVPGRLTHGFARLKAAVLHADHAAAHGLLHVADNGWRWVRRAVARRFPGGVKTETYVAGQLGGLLKLFRSLPLHLLQQTAQD
jgi:hypothetical protein